MLLTVCTVMQPEDLIQIQRSRLSSDIGFTPDLLHRRCRSLGRIPHRHQEVLASWRQPISDAANVDLVRLAASTCLHSRVDQIWQLRRTSPLSTPEAVLTLPPRQSSWQVSRNALRGQDEARKPQCALAPLKAPGPSVAGHSGSQ